MGRHYGANTYQYKWGHEFNTSLKHNMVSLYVSMSAYSNKHNNPSKPTFHNNKGNSNFGYSKICYFKLISSKITFKALTLICFNCSVALGGEYDRTGTIFKNTLIEIIKIEFELTIDMVVSTLRLLLTSDVAGRNTCKRSEGTPKKSTTTPSASYLTRAPPVTPRASAVTFLPTKDPPS